MTQAILRWGVYMAALLVLGPLAGALSAGLWAADGSRNASFLLTTTPMAGIVAAVGAFGLALLAGLAGGRIGGAPAAYTSAGLVLAWAAWRTTTIDELIRQGQSQAQSLGQSLSGASSPAQASSAGSWPMLQLAVEGGLLLIPALIVAGVFVAASRPMAEDMADGGHDGLGSRVLGWGRAWMGSLAGLAAGAVAAWLIAREPLKGQAMAGAIGAGLAAGAVARLVDYRTPLSVIFAGVALLAAVGPAATLVLSGSGLAQAAVEGRLFPLGHVLPMDWLAGAMLGVPLGAAWAGTKIEKQMAQAAPARG